MSDDESTTSFPSDDRILENVRELVKEVNIETMGQKRFVKKLAKKMNVPKLSKKREFVLKCLTKILNEEDDEDEEDSVESSESENESEDETPKNKKAKNNDGEAKPVSAFNSPKELSKALAKFLGKGTHMSRPQVVKNMWIYIREEKLQNPDKKSEIILDKAMKKVFEVDRFTMFQMNRHISAHIHPFKPLPTPEEEEEIRKRKEEEKARKKKMKKRKQKNPPKRRFALYRLSDILAELTGSEIMTRQKVTKELVNYTKNNNLQNPDDRRQIMCDDLLKRIMNGQESVTYFSMQKYISPHLVEKVGIDEGDDEKPQNDKSDDNDGYSS